MVACSLPAGTAFDIQEAMSCVSCISGSKCEHNWCVIYSRAKVCTLQIGTWDAVDLTGAEGLIV